MKGIVPVVIALAGILVMTVLRGIATDEIRGQLDRLPFALLRLARKRVPRELRVKLHDEEWEPELWYILQRQEARPISRLVGGTLYAWGLLLKARQISRMRAGSTAAGEKLRRLVSLSTAVNAIGNIATAGVGYASTSVVGFATSLGLVTVLGLVGTGMWLALKIVLATAFGLAMSVLLTITAGPGLRATFRRLIFAPPITDDQAANPQGKLVRFLSASDDFLSKSSGTRVPAIVAFLSCQVGVVLGIFAAISIAGITMPLTITVIAIAAIAVLRFLLVGAMLRRHKRRYARLKKVSKASS